MIRTLLAKLDPGVMGSLAVLITAGLLVLAASDMELFIRQLIWLSGAVTLMFALIFFNLRAILSYRWVILSIYFVVLALLVITYFVAPTVHGARSWIILGPLQIQPAEFMKAALIILLASFFATRHVAIARLGIIVRSFIYSIIPIIIILLQPDLGTSLVLMGIWFSYLLMSGLPAKFIIGGLLLIAILAVASWGFLLADYQKARIGALFQPESDVLGINYSVAQSKIAIGSAGLFGKGFGRGTQVQLGFLPAAETDFVFASFVEEWGLVGGALLIAAFVFLIYRLLRIGQRSANNFPKFIVLGTTAMLLIHFVINMGSVLGLLPVIGIGLPFVSYGGSNLLAAIALIGIIQSVSERDTGL